MSSAWVGPFLQALSVHGIVTRAAAIAGISSSNAYALRRVDGDFAAAWDQALEDSMDTIEEAARRRALGYEELVVHQGQLTPVWERDAEGQVVTELYGPEDKEGRQATRPVQARHADGSLQWLTVTKHSDAMTALLLKGRRKKVFADRTELTDGEGKALAVNVITGVPMPPQPGEEFA